ncbi:VWA domain-containing protein [Photobacterium profundum]|uniref:VWFA domain-containing protein n=1 Tax=Photobacterium profundum (strain SS9) TaxID=298386 RepID=Q6LJM7_PHOPR|nr:VWA domain-containing protein [Photobacterium profundum]CAG22503.1 hypothetical protein PBPRB0630 [Photobacterium profundum SS9]
MFNDYFDITGLVSRYQPMIKDNPDLDFAIKQQLSDCTQGLKLELIKSNPYTEIELALLNAELEFDEKAATSVRFKNDIISYQRFISQAQLPSDKKYWLKELTVLDDKVNKLNQQKRKITAIKTKHNHLLTHWRKQYDKAHSKWQLEAIRQFQEKFLSELNDWLEQIKILSEVVESLGLEPGYLLDFSEGKLTLSDVEKLKKWAEYLPNDEGVKSLCEMLGKLRQVTLSDKIETIKKTINMPEMVFDGDSKQEIVGLKLGKDLEHVLPSELALMSDPETSILFDLKYLESSLMCFDMAGISIDHAEQVVEQSIQKEDKKGPMVICIDTSGSMHGSPETIAKALSLYLTTQAKKEQRDCYLINISTSIEILDLSQGYSLSSLLTFLQKSFHGGTDVAPAMRHGINIMKNDAYENADMLIISDFVMSSLPNDCLELVEQQRIKGNRFYSLCIGNAFMTNRLKTHFDSEWVYNPSNSSITELIKFQNDVIDSAIII